MKTFRIFYWGLVAHIDTANKGDKFDFSVIVRHAGNHVPTILYKETDSANVDPIGLPLLSGVNFHTRASQVSVHPVRPPRDEAMAMAEDAPPLSTTIPGSKLRDEVGAGADSEFAFCVKYPPTSAPGRLTVCDSYATKTTHRPKKGGAPSRANKRVGRIHMMEFQVPDDLRMSFDSDPAAVDRAVPHCIFITNVEDGPTWLYSAKAADELDASSSHFEYWNNILIAPETYVTEEQESNAPNDAIPRECAWIRDVVTPRKNLPASTKSECGPATWP